MESLDSNNSTMGDRIVIHPNGTIELYNVTETVCLKPSSGSENNKHGYSIYTDLKGAKSGLSVLQYVKISKVPVLRQYAQSAGIVKV